MSSRRTPPGVTSVPEYYWDEANGRYRDANGRFIAQSVIEDALERRLVEGNQRLVDMLESVYNGDGTLEEWQQAATLELRRVHAQMAAFGKGGWRNMTSSDWGKVGNTLKNEYGFLRGFVEGMADGTVTRGQATVRIKMYGDGARKEYWTFATQSKLDGGFLWERRRLNAAVENCDDCLDYAAKGWQPLGTLPEPGEESVCRSNCKCTKEYSKSKRKPKG